eukprot:COSAG01_NODE_1885_length_8988_cov_2.861514_5_plen_215_part_00
MIAFHSSAIPNACVVRVAPWINARFQFLGAAAPSSLPAERGSRSCAFRLGIPGLLACDGARRRHLLLGRLHSTCAHAVHGRNRTRTGAIEARWVSAALRVSGRRRARRLNRRDARGCGAPSLAPLLSSAFTTCAMVTTSASTPTSIPTTTAVAASRETYTPSCQPSCQPSCRSELRHGAEEAAPTALLMCGRAHSLPRWSVGASPSGEATPRYT